MLVLTLRVIKNILTFQERELHKMSNSIENMGDVISEDELYKIISDAFYNILSPLTSDQRTKEIETLMGEFQVAEPPEQEATAKPILQVPGKTYRAISKSDLGFFAQIANIGVNAHFATALTILSILKSTVSFGLLIIIYQYWNKGIKLTYEQGIILKVLKLAAPPGFTPNIIANWISDKNKISEDEVKKVLESLKTIEKFDGTLANIVKETDGKWCALDI